MTCSGRTGGAASAEDATDEALTGQTLVLGADEFESGAWMSAGTGVAGAAVADVVARWAELAFAICDIVCVTVSGCATEGAATAGTLRGLMVATGSRGEEFGRLPGRGIPAEGFWTATAACSWLRPVANAFGWEAGLM